MISRNLLPRGFPRWVATAARPRIRSASLGPSEFFQHFEAPLLRCPATRVRRSPTNRSLRTCSNSTTLGQKPTLGHGHSGRPQQRARRGWKLLGGAVVASLAIALYAGISRDTTLTQVLAEALRGKPLNEKSFEPFTIVAREQVSSTSFIITAQPSKSLDLRQGGFVAGFFKDSHSNKPVFSKAWSHGLWHVEVKHPLIQVAREYTPLPPREGQEQHDLDRGCLRFLIRTVPGGEVSHYLSGLKVGDEIELRGPHLGFDVRTRLGDAGQLVFLAGGTGIAPALQVIRAVLDRDPDICMPGVSLPPKPAVSIIWANRRGSDCQGCGVLASGSAARGSTSEDYPNAVVVQLAEMQRRHGDRLDVACTVDGEGKFIGAAAITAAANKRPTNLLNSISRQPEETCQYHSPANLVNSEGKDPAEGACSCHGSQATASYGRKLVMVSGPDGFIAAFAGPKRWLEGKERQGIIGGVLGQLKARYPTFWNDWLVLKL